MGREQPISGHVELGAHGIVPNYFEQNQVGAQWPAGACAGVSYSDILSYISTSKAVIGPRMEVFICCDSVDDGWWARAITWR
jgi:hypothetical protein